MTRKQELQAVINQARSELNEIEEAELAESMATLLGKFFKYRNSYSCPEDEADYWWLYQTYVDLHGTVMCVEFQTDKFGKFEVERKEAFHMPYGKMLPIKAGEFYTAWEKAVSDATALMPKELVVKN